MYFHDPSEKIKGWKHKLVVSLLSGLIKTFLEAAFALIRKWLAWSGGEWGTTVYQLSVQGNNKASRICLLHLCLQLLMTAPAALPLGFVMPF